MLWAEEGEGFKCIELINNEGIKFKAAIAICRDILSKYDKDFDNNELAYYCLQERIDVLLFSTAWVDLQPEI